MPGRDVKNVGGKETVEQNVTGCPEDMNKEVAATAVRVAYNVFGLLSYCLCFVKFA